MMGHARVSLFWRILLSTSIAITLLFGLTGWLVQRHAIDTVSRMLEEEVAASFEAYESLWKSRTRALASVSRLLSTMSDVRAAFSTGDRATIRDTAAELWSRISDAGAIFVVTDPNGAVIASLAEAPSEAIEGHLGFVVTARSRFPEQSSGFVYVSGRLYQVAVTPVYVHSGPGAVLLNVAVAGYRVDSQLASLLKRATGGSEFVFASGSKLVATTMDPGKSQTIIQSAAGGERPAGYVPLRSELRDLAGNSIAELWILRSFESVRDQIATLRRNIFLMYLLALSSGLLLTSLLARRIVEPIKELDRAAFEVSRGNYDHRVQARGRDELGRLGATFNSMCKSIQSARDDLIRQERIATIGQMSTSIVHDLRNPLAAIYGGAEMLVDGELPQQQVKRLASNIYRASRNIQELLQELADISEGKANRTELCNLHDIVTAAFDPVRALAETSGVQVHIDVPPHLEVPLARARMERVFSNLIVNAIEAMKAGGVLRIAAHSDSSFVHIAVTDTGPGISSELRRRIFQPFVSEGKRNGLGLGLALSRQTVLNHGGELWLAPDSPGARFCLKLPLEPAPAEVNSAGNSTLSL